MFNLKQKFEKFDENWRSDLEKAFSSSNKKSAEKHAFWIDHEFLRILYHNNFEIAPGVFRSNQPSEKRILEWQKEKGIQSIINFRGESNQGAFFIEKNTKVDDKISDLLTQRQKARSDKDWDLADKIREEIDSLGYVIEDTDQGPIVKRK